MYQATKVRMREEQRQERLWWTPYPRFIAFYCRKRSIMLYYEHLFVPRVL